MHICSFAGQSTWHRAQFDLYKYIEEGTVDAGIYQGILFRLHLKSCEIRVV